MCPNRCDVWVWSSVSLPPAYRFWGIEGWFLGTPMQPFLWNVKWFCDFVCVPASFSVICQTDSKRVSCYVFLTCVALSQHWIGQISKEGVSKHMQISENKLLWPQHFREVHWFVTVWMLRGFAEKMRNHFKYKQRCGTNIVLLVEWSGLETAVMPFKVCMRGKCWLWFHYQNELSSAWVSGVFMCNENKAVLQLEHPHTTNSWFRK